MSLITINILYKHYKTYNISNKTQQRMTFEINSLANVKTLEINRAEDRLRITAKMKKIEFGGSGVVPDHTWHQGNLV